MRGGCGAVAAQRYGSEKSPNRARSIYRRSTHSVDTVVKTGKPGMGELGQTQKGTEEHARSSFESFAKEALAAFQQQSADFTKAANKFEQEACDQAQIDAATAAAFAESDLRSSVVKNERNKICQLINPPWCVAHQFQLKIIENHRTILMCPKWTRWTTVWHVGVHHCTDKESFLASTSRVNQLLHKTANNNHHMLEKRN